MFSYLKPDIVSATVLRPSLDDEPRISVGGIVTFTGSVHASVRRRLTLRPLLLADADTALEARIVERQLDLARDLLRQGG